MPEHCSGGRRNRPRPVRLVVLGLTPVLAYAVLVVAGRSALPKPQAVNKVSRLLDRGFRISPNTAAPSLITTPAPAASRPRVDRSRPTRAPFPTITKAPSPATDLVPAATAGGLSTPEQEALALTNHDRARKGCPALTLDSRLTRVARDHATDMVAKHYFDHVAPDGRTPSDRARAAGYPRGVGENMAVGYATAAAVIEGWMSSSGHRANILNCSYTAVGIGFDPGAVRSTVRPGTWVEVLGEH